MAGRPRERQARTELLRVRMTPAAMEVLDRLRPPLDRLAYVRSLIYKAWEEKK